MSADAMRLGGGTVVEISLRVKGNAQGNIREERRRSMRALFAGVALTNTTMVGASTIGTLVAADTIGPMWSGVPNAAGVFGTAAGTWWLARLATGRGTRPALVTGYLVTAVGAVLAMIAVARRDLFLLTGAMLLIGIGNGGCQLSRYLAAERYPARRRSAVLATIMWAGTIGALIGPNLIPASTAAVPSVGLPANSGPYLFSLLTAIGAAAVSMLIPRGRPAEPQRKPGTGAVHRASHRPVVLVAVTAMATGQVAMVAVMTMAPLQMQDFGQGFGAMGLVLTVHMVGMFALAPLSGLLAGRFGGNATILAGVAVMLASMVCVMTVPSGSGPMPYVSMFLLGYGWNLMFVGSSSLLTSRLPEAGRIRVEGTADAVVWIGSALASVAGGALMAGPGYAVLAAIVAGAMLLPVVLIVHCRRPRTSSATGYRESSSASTATPWPATWFPLIRSVHRSAGPGSGSTVSAHPPLSAKATGRRVATATSPRSTPRANATR